MKIEIKKIIDKNINVISDLPPEEWNFDIVKFMNTYKSLENFYAVVVKYDNKLISTGNLFITGRSSWLGNIIVKPDYWRNNIAKKITEHLIDYSEKYKCDTINLIATYLVKIVYSKLGFTENINYKFYKGGNLFNSEENKKIINISSDDLKDICKIDKFITGDDRKEIIKILYTIGYKYISENNIKDFYIPSLGNGIIIAEDSETGIELMKFKHSKENQVSIIPENNKIAINLLRNNNFIEYSTATRMYRGNLPNWKPEGMFCRISGYLS